MALVRTGRAKDQPSRPLDSKTTSVGLSETVKQGLELPAESFFEDVPQAEPVVAGDPTKANRMKGIDKQMADDPEGPDPISQEIATKTGGVATLQDDLFEFKNKYGDVQEEVQKNLEMDAATAEIMADDPNLLDVERADELQNRVNELRKRRLEEAEKADLDAAQMRVIRRKLEASANLNEYESLTSHGNLLNEKLDEAFANIVNEEGIADSNINVGPQVRSILENAGLLVGNKLSGKVGMGLAVAALQLIKDMEMKKDQRRIKEDGVERFDPKGDVISHDDIRNRLSESVLNKIVENPNQVDATRAKGYGGFGSTLPPEVKSALDTIFYNVLNKAGAFEIITTKDGEKFTIIKPKYKYYFEFTAPILDDIFPEDRVNVSYTPTIAGEALYSLARVTRRDIGGISKKNRTDPNTSNEEEIKTVLGSMPLAVVQERFKWAQKLVGGMVERDQNGAVQLINQTGNEAGFYLTGPFAETVGLGEKRWRKAYKHALKTMNEREAADQANLVMRQTALMLVRTMQDGMDNSFVGKTVVDPVTGQESFEQTGTRIFYNKWMHASSVGRYFVRNTILNGQNNKLVRNFVGSAQPIKINVNDKKGLQYNNWKYIIGKNLLDNTENQGWDHVSKRATAIIEDDKNPTYAQWVLRGEELYNIVNDDTKGLADIQKLGYANELTDAGEWSYVMQSYIDMYKYDLAKKSGIPFDAKAQTQHDGKQNGIAIMAMQSGNERLMELVGAIFDGQQDVIPQGDVRGAFGKQLENAIDNVNTMSKEKKAFWQNVLMNMEQSGDYNGLLKSLCKVPLMEVCYGKSNNFHHETAEAFIEGSKDSLGNLIVDPADWAGPEYDTIDMTEDLNEVIKQALKDTLNLQHQSILKTTGLNWAMLGVTPELKGPMGNKIYMGSYDYQPIEVVDKQTGEKSIKEVTFMMDGEEQRVTLTQPVASGSKQTGKRKLVKTKDEVTGKIGWTLQDKSKFGQEVANQLPVLTVQQIDAAIMGRTIQEVNRRRREQGIREPLFMQPVHDAIITDANSVDVYHREINSQFFKVNNNYSIAEEVQKGYMDAHNSVTAKLRGERKSTTYELNYDSPYRALHDFILGIHLANSEEKRIRRKTIPGSIGPRLDYPDAGREVDIEGGTPAKQTYGVTHLPAKGRRDFLFNAIKMGWSPDGTGKIVAEDLAQLLDDVKILTNVEGMIEDWIDTSRSDRKKAYKRIPKEKVWRFINNEWKQVWEARLYQYN